MTARYSLALVGQPFGPGTRQFGIAGWPTVAIQVVGSVTGTYTPQATLDGITWVNVPVITTAYTRAATITAAGLYRADVNGYQVFRLSTSDASGAHQVYMFAAMEPVGSGDAA